MLFFFLWVKPMLRSMEFLSPFNALIPSLQRLSKRVLWHDRSRLGLESFIRVISLDLVRESIILSYALIEPINLV